MLYGLDEGYQTHPALWDGFRVWCQSVDQIWRVEPCYTTHAAACGAMATLIATASKVIVAAILPVTKFLAPQAAV